MTPLTTPDIVLRVAVAFLAGSVLGIERQTHGRAAGFRTNLLVCVASALTMVISELLFTDSAGSSWRPDPARLGAGLLAGMGFLGAGTIIRHENMIRGVTTAATLWFAAILGMAFGAGYFIVGAIGLGIALVALLALPLVERRLPIDWYCKLIVTYEMNVLTGSQIKERLERIGLKVKDFEMDCDLVKKTATVSCEVELQQSERFELSQKAISELSNFPGILHVKWL